MYYTFRFSKFYNTLLFSKVWCENEHFPIESWNKEARSVWVIFCVEQYNVKDRLKTPRVLKGNRTS